MSTVAAQKTLAGWGRFAPASCTVLRPERASALHDLLAEPPQSSWIPRGLGRSYGDAAVNSGGAVLDLSRLNRVIAFDAETGTLTCEGGVRLAMILDAFVRRGYFLPVTPGTKYVSVAGAIANDVHGKNHHCDGTFIQFVESFDLWTPARGVIPCSRTENSDVFWATAGGVGLTGIILRATMRLRRIESAYVRVDYQRCSHLDKVLDAMAASDKEYLYSVAWVDCLASKGSLGRSVLMRGNHATQAELPLKQARTPFRLPNRLKLTMPMDLPGFALNSLGIKAFNTLFYAKNRDAQGVFVDYDKYFYPLDGILHWNRMYGKHGFIQYQATFPYDGRAGLVSMLEKLAAAGRASFLAVLKCFGAANEGLLSYPFPGYTLALDIPNRPGVGEFAAGLDRILLDHGGRLYLAKDALTRPEVFAAMYPQLPDFRSLQAELDPQGVLRSSMSRRLQLTE